MNLYEIAKELRAIEGWIDERGEEIEAAGGEIPADVADRLEALDASLEAKVEAIVEFARTAAHNAEGARREATRLMNLASSYEARHGRLKDWLALCIDAAGVGRVETPRVKAWTQLSGTPSVKPLDERKIPPRFKRVRLLSNTISPATWTEIVQRLGGPEEASALGLRREEQFDYKAAVKALRDEEKMPTEAGRHELEEEGVVVVRRRHAQYH